MILGGVIVNLGWCHCESWVLELCLGVVVANLDGVSEESQMANS